MSDMKISYEFTNREFCGYNILHLLENFDCNVHTSSCCRQYHVKASPWPTVLLMSGSKL